MKKWINELSIDELKIKRKNGQYITWFCLAVGTFYTLGGFFSDALFLLICGIALLFLAILPNNLSLMIYLKEQEKK